MTSILSLTRRYRNTFGDRAFVGEVVGVPAVCLAMAIAACGVTAALSPTATEPLRVSSHSGDGRLSQVGR